MKIPRKRYKTVLAMVWGTSGSLSFKLWFTRIVLIKKLKRLFTKEDK